MSLAGPELPPHLAATRKRQAEEQAAQPTPSSHFTSPSNDGGHKRRRVLGPSLPPAPLDELPLSNANAEADTESDDDIGPSLPPPPGLYNTEEEILHAQTTRTTEQLTRETVKKPQREEWMLVPPKKDELSSRLDPTKLKNRKFNTGKGAKGPVSNGGSDNSLWTETPEEKRKRLEDEIMGVKKPAQLAGVSSATAISITKAKETDQRIREYNEKNRSSSLYNEHKRAMPKEKEDDPSQREFDKEKDIGGGMKINHSKKKELLTRAADFGSRFAKGNYL